MKKGTLLIVAFLILPSLFAVGSRQIQSEIVSNAPPRPSKTSYPMPDFEIECPSSPIKPGNEAVFTLRSKTDEKIIEKSRPIYDWSVSNGEIISGQGTRSIQVKTSPNSQGNLTVQVRVTAQAGGYLNGSVTESCIIPFEDLPVPVLKDEFAFSVQGELKARLDAYFIELANNPSDQGYIFIFPKSAAEQARIERIIRDFIGWRKYDPSRVTTVIGEKSSRTILQFWLKPPGADAPKPELNAEYRLPVPQNVVKANPAACELNGLHLEGLQIERGNNPNLLIKVVFSPGKTETAAVNLKRQKIFMDKFKKRFPDAQSITGAKTEGEGEVAIFIQEPGREEQFYLLIYAIKNKSICLACCEPSDAPKSLLGRTRR